MDTAVRTPLAVFSLPQRLVVPLFQRPYVWDEDEQWAPLWQDVRRLAGHHLSNPGSPATHFLGAIVLQASDSTVGSIPSWSIIDGQQRLTTLQVFFDAAAAVFEDRGLDNFTGQLEALTHNASAYVQGEEVALKLRHTNDDRGPYDEVMLADPPVPYDVLKHSSSRLARAHRYFAECVAAWIDEDGLHPAAARAQALTGVLTQSLQIVVISLRADEDSQEIFETLNARGTPLTAADLVRNFVFQRLSADGVDTEMAYKEIWPFKTRFWEKEVSVGRNLVSRSSLFLNQWLISRVGEEIGPKSTFARFKHYVEHESSRTMSELLAEIHIQADRYQAWTDHSADAHADLNAVEMCVYRMNSSQVESIKPVLIWLHEPGVDLADETRDGVVAMVESWMVRRVMLRLSLGDLGRVVADLVRVHRGAPPAEVVASVRGFLTRLDSASTYWPGDAEIRETLGALPAYRRYTRSRLRMLLEAAEDHSRGFTADRASFTGMRVPRLGFPIEHLLPQKWQSHWPVDDLAQEVERDAHVHRLGNLTLLTAALNSSVSNGAWLGDKGKRAKLAQHDVLLLNRWVRDRSESGWDEELIDERTADLVEALLATWPVPEGHVGLMKSDKPVADGDVSLKALIAAGLLEVGSVLRPRSSTWGEWSCEVLDTGELLLDGQRFASPSGAGHHVRKGATNGWVFWKLPDGRMLKDVRATYRGASG